MPSLRMWRQEHLSITYEDYRKDIAAIQARLLCPFPYGEIDGRKYLDGGISVVFRS